MLRFAKHCLKIENFFSKSIHQYFMSTANVLATRSKKRDFDDNLLSIIQKAYRVDVTAHPRSIVEVLKRNRSQIKLNETIALLFSVAMSYRYNKITFKLTHQPFIEELLIKIKSQLKENDEEYPLIGALMSTLKMLEYYDDKEFWMILWDYLVSGRMYSSFTEKILTLKSCLYLKQIGRASCRERV